jgi:hypothetical protein
MLSPSWKFFAVALILTTFFPASARSATLAFRDSGNQPAGSNPRHSRSLTKSSGYIFAGMVKSFERVAPKGNGVATVQISFRVDQAMQGVHTGQMLTIREWGGLWQSDERRTRSTVSLPSEQVRTDQPGPRAAGSFQNRPPRPGCARSGTNRGQGTASRYHGSVGRKNECQPSRGGPFLGFGGRRVSPCR